MPQITIRQIINSTLRLFNRALVGQGPKYESSKAKAFKWLKDTILKFKVDDDSKQISDYVIKFPGTFYMLHYQSKWYDIKDKHGNRVLPWFDAYPLILVISVTKDYFLGINFHYLPIKTRVLVIRRLLNYYKKKFVQDQILRPMNWDVFKRIINVDKRIKNHAIKKYLWTHVKKIRGLRVVRIKNMEVLYSLFYISPQWVGITETGVKSKFNKASRR